MYKKIVIKVNDINFVFIRLIRLTSPKLNYFIGIGAIILYIDISLSVAPTTDPKIVTILCNVSKRIPTVKDNNKFLLVVFDTLFP